MPASLCSTGPASSSSKARRWPSVGLRRRPPPCLVSSPAPTSWGPAERWPRTPAFAIDQLVEVAIRALSPAVNDTFTALNCLDWLGDCLCLAARQRLPRGVYRDPQGLVRLIEPAITLDFLVKRASDKIRQAGRGMPAVLIRQLENLRRITLAPPDGQPSAAILGQAEMIMRATDESVPEESDRSDVRAAFEDLMSAVGSLSDVSKSGRQDAHRLDATE